MKHGTKIAVLGASGLIGATVTEDFLRRGLPVIAIARHFTRPQRAAFADAAIEMSILKAGADRLRHLFAEHSVDIVLNCIGVLQSGPKGRASDVHVGFVSHMVAAIHASDRPILFIQLSIPESPEDDRTEFSRTKRAAEHAIIEAGNPFVILRPGFVIAPAAYGGSALIRALATLPFDLPLSLAGRPFAATAVADIAETVARVAAGWRAGKCDWQAQWDVMANETTTVGDVIAAFRGHFGGPPPRWRLSPWLLALGAFCGDLASVLGWSPPVRSTALAEMRRGVGGDPSVWSTETGIRPRRLTEALDAIHATIQERWFARLYLMKALIIGGLGAFWVASGLVALTVGSAVAVADLVALGLPEGQARAVLDATSLFDILVGIAVIVRRTSKVGLRVGIALSCGYLAATTFLAPALWLDPLGALVKVIPIIVLMGTALAILDDR